MDIPDYQLDILFRFLLEFLVLVYAAKSHQNYLFLPQASVNTVTCFLPIFANRHAEALYNSMMIRVSPINRTRYLQKFFFPTTKWTSSEHAILKEC